MTSFGFLPAHHLQLHPPAVSTAWCRGSTGQCSPGVLALSRVGHPHPSRTGSRSIFLRNGVPQYDTPRLITRSGHRSQISALASQPEAIRLAPKSRKRDDAALAMARDIDRNELEAQLKHDMPVLSDLRGGSLACNS